MTLHTELLLLATTARLIGDLETNRTSPSGPPARYLIIRPQADLPEARQKLALIFGSEPFELSILDAESLVLEFPNRSFPLSTGEPTAAQHLGAKLRDSLDALLVEPDLPRAAAPVMPDRVPGLESVDDFPPGCWVGEEADLNDRPLWALDALKVRQAWRLSQRLARPAMGSGIIIAQPDTGITAHVELAGVPLAGAFNTLGDGPPNSAADPLDTGFALNPGHGSATMSVAVSRSRDEADRMVGTAPLASHMPIRALRSVWAHEELPIARAVDLAVEKGAHVITMSLGGVALPFSPLRAAIRRAVAKQVIVMAAAGNCVGIVVYPARFAECIAVGGTDQRGGKWPGSCAGAAVDISAPGQNVLRASVEPRPQGSIGQGQGTSFAVALLSGVAACWLAHHGRGRLIAEAHARGETLQTMFRRLVRATAHRPAGWDGTRMGAGIADAEALLKAPFDLGIETESPAFEAELRAPADEMRAFITELAGADPELDDDALLRHGSAIGAALLSLRLDPAATPELSPELVSALKGPLAQRFGRALAGPSVRLADSDVLAAQAERTDRLRRSVAFGKATAAGDSIESAAGGGATVMPEAGELSAKLDQLLAKPDNRSPGSRADFEKAVELIRLHGTRGIEKLADPGTILLPAELAAAEAVIKADGSRPSFLIRDGKIDPNDPFAGSWGERLLALRDDIETRAAMCGRIQPTRGHANRYCGTGALIDPSGPWVLSNFHVIQQALRSYPLFQFPTERGLRITGGLEIDFAAETDTTATNRWTIEEAVFPNGAGEGFGYIDAVLLRLGRSLDSKPLPPGEPGHTSDRFVFSPIQGFVTGEMPVLALIGFPNRPPQSSGTEGGIDWGWVVGQLFGGRFGVKRLAPGEFYRTIGSHPKDAETRYTFGYDATTMKGSSGSPTFSLSEAGSPAFGLHFAGYDNESNFALTTAALQRGFEGRGVAFP
ncbi:S8 family peptidase [Rhizobium laguerreae]|uniref:S8 family peptidase n=1 Tax=Rhizobium laguerreae TaxID=1076926 RepID=UPI001C92AE11|nr:S8 family serine peptidase [Rhizobium laguerreae]MBY3495647.1 S8 family serine peptidase [Rhizobium laguerreae]